VIEFLVEKHKTEFNNLAARIGFSTGAEASALQSDGLTSQARALLDRFILENGQCAMHHVR